MSPRTNAALLSPNKDLKGPVFKYLCSRTKSTQQVKIFIWYAIKNYQAYKEKGKYGPLISKKNPTKNKTELADMGIQNYPVCSKTKKTEYVET